MAFLYKLTFCRSIMTLSTIFEIILQIKLNLSPAVFTPVLRKLTKLLLSSFFASNCTYMNNPNTMLFIYLHLSLLYHFLY